MVTRATLAGVAALILLLLAGCDGPERKVLRGGTKHLPLLDGREMRYRETENGVTREITMHMHYAGGNRVRVYDIKWVGPDDEHYGTFLSDSSKVFYATAEPLVSLGGYPEYRELWVDETVSHGDTWEEPETGVETVYAGTETVSVPAGSWNNCYKTVSTVTPVYMDSLEAQRTRGDVTPDEYDELADLKDLSIVRWFAPGVGLVKEQVSHPDRLRELIAVVKPGTGKDAPLPPADTIYTEPQR